jgi:hypothetical protein
MLSLGLFIFGVTVAQRSLQRRSLRISQSWPKVHRSLLRISTVSIVCAVDGTYLALPGVGLQGDLAQE